VNEDQDIDGVGVSQPTYALIHDEYDWESKLEPTVKDELLPPMPPSLFPNIFGDSAIFDFPCVNPYTDASTSDHSQNTTEVSPSFDSGEDKFSIENPLDFSFTFSGNAKGERSFFSSTPLYNSSDHENSDELIDFYDRICRDLFTPIFDHNDSFNHC